MITREMIDDGIANGYIQIADHNGIPVCRIGEYWFFFAGKRGETCLSVTNYLLNQMRKEVIEDIFQALESFRQPEEIEQHDEYQYYEWYLREHLNLTELATKTNC